MSKVGRNEQCPCGSGKKYKKCCGGSAVAFSIPIPDFQALAEQWVRLFDAYNTMLDEQRVQDALLAYAEQYGVSTAEWTPDEGFDSTVLQAWWTDPRASDEFWSLWSGGGAVAQRVASGDFALWRVEEVTDEFGGYQTAMIVRQRFTSDTPRRVILAPGGELRGDTHLVGTVVTTPAGDFMIMPLMLTVQQVFDDVVEDVVERGAWKDDDVYRIDVLRAVTGEAVPTYADIGHQLIMRSECET